MEIERQEAEVLQRGTDNRQSDGVERQEAEVLHRQQ